jgi:hypothetical protein
MKEDERKLERVLRKYAMNYASQETDAVRYTGEDLALNVQIYAAYANYLSAKRIERLTYVLAFSTLVLAIATVVGALIRGV